MAIIGLAPYIAGLCDTYFGLYSESMVRSSGTKNRGVVARVSPYSSRLAAAFLESRGGLNCGDNRHGCAIIF